MKQSWSFACGLVLASLALGAPAGAADASPAPEAPSFDALSFRLIGPYRGGRSTAVAGVPSEPHTFYMGTTGGGVWKTTDGGLSWENVSDAPRDEPDPYDLELGDDAEGIASEPLVTDPFGTASVGAIAVADSDPNVVYVGMGSACIRGNVSPGDGVYRSRDGGKSWAHVGLEDAGQIGRIRVHPADPDLVWVAVLGHAFGPNATRGVYRSTDGGDTWTRVLHVSSGAGAVDLALDVTNPRILYAAIWEASRSPWDAISGGPGSGLYKSVDGGDSWRPMTKGLPEGILGRSAVAVSPANPARVWVLVEHADEGGLYRSDDGGESFRLVNGDRNYLQRAWYYTHVYADPQDAESLYILNVAMWKSTDAGDSFSIIRTPHGDNHDLWINPHQPNVMVQANDGGGNVSVNGGRTWTTQSNQPTAEVYRVTVDDQWPYWVYGSQQDNSSFALPSRTADGGIGAEDFRVIGGCESGHVAVDPRSGVSYSGCYGGTIGRYDAETGQEREVMAWPQLAVGQKAEDLKYRFQWNAPIRISPHDPSVLYHTSNVVHRSTNEGQSWEVVSPDLTRDDVAKQGYAGGPITWDNTGVEVYGTIFAFEISPHEPGVLWAGTDDGRVHISRDDAATWTEITPAAMPAWGTVNAIDLSAHGPGRALLAVQRYRQDDFRPYVFRTDDYGATWTSLANGRNGIPADHFVRVVREDPVRKGLLYAGTEFGLYASWDDGATWRPFQLDLPVTPVTDLQVKGDDLVVGTQGRSIWILDHLGPVRETTPEVAAAATHLFPPADTVRFGGGGGFGGGGTEGRNPPRGVVVYYTLDEDLSEKEAEEVTLEILDAGGEVLRTISSQKPEVQAPSPWRAFFPGDPPKLAAKEGMNRYVWNFRRHDAKLVPDAVLWGLARGPEVPPGTYTVRLTRGEWSDEASFEVTMDPRLDATVADHQARYELATKIWRRIEAGHDVLRKVRSVRDQVAGVQERLKEAGVEADLSETAKPLGERLDGIEQSIYQTKSKAGQDILNFPPKLDNQLLFLMGVVESADTRPTDQAFERFEELDAELTAIETDLDAVIATELAAFNAAAAEHLTAPVMVPAAGDD